MSNDPQPQRIISQIRTQEKPRLEILEHVQKPELSNQGKDGQNFGSYTGSTLASASNTFEYL